jgi:hypothetical protein
MISDTLISNVLVFGHFSLVPEFTRQTWSKIWQSIHAVTVVISDGLHTTVLPEISALALSRDRVNRLGNFSPIGLYVGRSFEK